MFDQLAYMLSEKLDCEQFAYWAKLLLYSVTL